MLYETPLPMSRSNDSIHPSSVRRTVRAILILSVLAAGGAMAQQPEIPPANVRAGLVLRQPVRDMRLIVGQVEPARRSIVTAQQAGQVVEAPPEAGLAVKAGQVIAKLDDQLLQLDLEAAKGALAEAEAQREEHQALVDTAARNRQRIEELYQSRVTNEKEIADARDLESAARARWRLTSAMIIRTTAQIHRLERQIDYMTVEAPFKGHVVHKETELGQWIAPGDPIAEIVETEHVKARLDVPESIIAQVPRDEPVMLTIDALGVKLEAAVFSVVPDADPQTRTFRVFFRIPNEDGAIKPGMSVSAELPTSTLSERLTVPKDAVQQTPAGALVTVNRGGAAATVPVMVRFSAGDRFVVDGALSPGDQVVVEGNERLMPGQPLNIVNSGELAVSAESGTGAAGGGAGGPSAQN